MCGFFMQPILRTFKNRDHKAIHIFRHPAPLLPLFLWGRRFPFMSGVDLSCFSLRLMSVIQPSCMAVESVAPPSL